MSEVNVVALKAALEYITEHPDEWQQCHWARRTACGTACCLAGRATLLVGYELDWERTTYWDFNDPEHPHGRQIEFWSASRILPHPDYPESSEGDSALNIENVSNDVFGLDRGEGEQLYDGDNQLWELWEIAEEFSDGEITPPASVIEMRRSYFCER